ncbi:hypothetical protein Dalk_4568 [Desulfatibacillum aliphaticivorans]|uniref:Uncharacterized protein n=1 Tax=Desulfatibacillum aliphaticivorans TaxID=218208 RepID=B8FNG5_DESAL|nr:hypothetical protein [Desulfatibacillum aliphaticivorans]ACL06246.1 hypothetical protein Dalk_4568 [Desulfatibacillum aliphaticivorans]
MRKTAILAAFVLCLGFAITSAFVAADANRTMDENFTLRVNAMQDRAAIRFLYGHSLELDAKCRKLDECLTESLELIDGFERLYLGCIEEAANAKN